MSPKLRSRLGHIVFGQDDAPVRLSLVRLALGAAVLRTVAHFPHGSFFQEHSDTLMVPPLRARPARPLDADTFEVLRRVTLGAVTLWTLGVRSRTLSLVATASFAALNRSVVELFPSVWSYNSHLNIFLAVASMVDTTERFAIQGIRRRRRGPSLGGRLEEQSAALAFMQLYYACVYAQSGLSKLVHGGGIRWVTGRTLQASLAELGTPAGKALAKHRGLMTALSGGTLAYELAFLPALVLGWRRRRWLGISSMLFHASIHRYMRISFWHLWWLAPALFVAPTEVGRRRLRPAGGRRYRRTRPRTARR